MTQTQELLILLVTLLNVILNTYQDNSRSDCMANHVGVFANIRTFLEEGKSFSTFMKYTLCRHRSQLETTGISVRNENYSS